GGASFVGFQTHGDGLGAVIFALEEASAAAIADTLALRRSFCDVENRLTFFAGAAAAQALDNLVQRQFVVHYGAERNPFFLHQIFQGYGLAEGARKSVEDEAATIEDTVAALAHHFPDGGIGHEFAAAHI